MNLKLGMKHQAMELYKVYIKVQVGKDQEKAQSEKVSHSKNRGGKKNKLTIRYLNHDLGMTLIYFMARST